ncbi:MAG: hypothetical protein AAGC88_12790 [Bacteroidota bacterium]
MIWLVGFLILALVSQVVLFFVIRKKKKEMQSGDILFRYNINSRGDLYKTLARQDLDKSDRQELQALYDKDD